MASELDLAVESFCHLRHQTKLFDGTALGSFCDLCHQMKLFDGMASELDLAVESVVNKAPTSQGLPQIISTAHKIGGDGILSNLTKLYILDSIYTCINQY